MRPLSRYSLTPVLALLAISAACSRKQPATAVTPAPAVDAGNGQRNQVAPQPTERNTADADAERNRLERERAAREAMKQTLTAPVYFEFDRSDLSETTRATLDAKVDVLRGNPQIRLRVEGHTDDRGSDEYNLSLGQRRAAAAKRYLTQHGISEDRLETASFGVERPTCTGAEESCRSRNRRAEFAVDGM